jgi:hypothetical protein
MQKAQIAKELEKNKLTWRSRQYDVCMCNNTLQEKREKNIIAYNTRLAYRNEWNIEIFAWTEGNHKQNVHNRLCLNKKRDRQITKTPREQGTNLMQSVEINGGLLFNGLSN